MRARLNLARRILRETDQDKQRRMLLRVSFAKRVVLAGKLGVPVPDVTPEMLK